MKKILVVLLALVLALSAFAAMAEEKEFDVRVLVWKFDDTYGSSVRQAMMDSAVKVGEELGCKINLQLYDAADDMAKQVEQATMLVGEKPDFIIINLAEVASGQQLVDMFTAADIPFFAVGMIGSFISALIAVKAFVRLVGHMTLVPFAVYRLLLAPFIWYFMVH